LNVSKIIDKKDIVKSRGGGTPDRRKVFSCRNSANMSVDDSLLVDDNVSFSAHYNQVSPMSKKKSGILTKSSLHHTKRGETDAPLSERKPDAKS
jgi:hypothetical protein